MNAITTTATSTAMSGEQLTAAIRHEHEAASTAARSAIGHALEAGRLLAEARAAIPHGGWESYVRDECDISPRTASLYLRLHRNRDRLPNRQHAAELSVRQAARLLERPKATVGAEAPGEPNAGSASGDQDRLLHEGQVFCRIDEINGVLRNVENGIRFGESVQWQAERMRLAVRLARDLRRGVPPEGQRAPYVDQAIGFLCEALSDLEATSTAARAGA